MKKHLRQNAFGFSLVELMITVGIIGLLASVATPAYSLFSDKARYGRARYELGGFKDTVVATRNSEDRYLIQSTGNACSSCSAPALAGWAGLGYTTIPRDPWGEPYYMDENEGENSPTDCRNDIILSSGKNRVVETPFDGKTAGGDDVLIIVPFHTDQHTGCPYTFAVQGGL